MNISRYIVQDYETNRKGSDTVGREEKEPTESIQARDRKGELPRTGLRESQSPEASSGPGGNGEGGGLLSRRFLLDDNLEMRGDVFVQFQGHSEFAEGLERLVQLDLAAVDFESLLAERLGDVTGRDRAKKLVMLAAATLEVDRYAIKLLGQVFRLRLFLGRAAHRGSLHL